jgi:hypothetical protein
MGDGDWGFDSSDDAYGIPSSLPVASNDVYDQPNPPPSATNNDVYDQPNPPPSTYAVPSSGPDQSSNQLYSVPSRREQDIYDQPNPPTDTYAIPNSSGKATSPTADSHTHMDDPIESTVDDTYEVAPVAQQSIQLYAPVEALDSTSDDTRMHLDPHAANPVLLLSDSHAEEASTVDRSAGYNEHVLLAAVADHSNSDDTLRTQARTHPAFKGLLSRREATTTLNKHPVGTFLLRLSGTVNTTVLSFTTLERMQHFTVTQEDGGVRVDKTLLEGCTSVHEAVTSLIEQKLIDLRFFLDADDVLMPSAALTIPEPRFLSRQEAEAVLLSAPDGSFVLRKRKGDRSWALTHTSKGSLSHHLIEYDAASQAFVLNGKQHLTGSDVVQAIYPLFLEVGAGLIGLLVAPASV